MIHWELYKKFEFDRTNKWYMRNLEFVLENDTRKRLKGFETDHLISSRRPVLVIVNTYKTNNLPICGLCYPGRPQRKIERKRKKR